MRRIVLLAFALLFAVCSSGYADTLPGYPDLVFPIEGDTVYTHLEGSRFHVFRGLTVQDGKRASDLFALDLSISGGTKVRPIADGKVVWVDTSYGYVIVEHSIPITTDSEYINTYVNGKIWYSGYMHMKNIPVRKDQTVSTSTKLGEVSNVHPSASLSDHLHFAVYDKDMYSFSPYLLGDAFREKHIEYKYDYTGRKDFESDKEINAACQHYWADEETRLGRELTEDELHANIKAKYTGTSTEVWFFSEHYQNYRSNDTNTDGGDLNLELSGTVNYSQDWLYQSSGQWQNTNIFTDSQGQMYFALYDSDGSSTYIYRVDSALPGAAGRSDVEGFTRIMTIQGRASVSLSPDETRPYIYYKLSGDDTHLYRMLLGQSGGSEVRDFSLDGSNFVFSGFDLVDYNQILLVSKEDNGTVTIGLFSYSDWDTGSNEPLRTWTCTLPSERSFEPLLDGEVGYNVNYEAGTDKVWLTVLNSYHYSSRQVNYYAWYYSAPLNGNGVLERFDAAAHIPGWSTAPNYKILTIGRYYRSVQFMDTETPNVAYVSAAVYRVESGGSMSLLKVFDTWQDSSGNTQDFGDFWSGGNGSIRSYGSATDPSGGYMALDVTLSSNGNADFVRIVHFAAEKEYVIAQPENKSTPAVQTADRITLTVEPFSGPEGYEAIGSHWEVFAASDVADGIYEGKTSVYEADMGDAGEVLSAAVNDYSSHTLNSALPEGSYMWRMFYRYQVGGAGSQGQRGTSSWSEPSVLSVIESSTVVEPEIPDVPYVPNTDDVSRSSGGCDSGILGVIVLAAGLIFRKRTR